MGFALKIENLPKYTYNDYCQWEGRWELIEGIPYSMSPQPVGKHQWICKKLSYQFEDELEICGKCNVSLPMDWKIDENTVLQPDLFVACFNFKNLKFITESPIIVVEVLSPSTRDKDITVKFNIYQEQGVKYYVIIDPEDDSYKIYELTENKYQLVKSGHDGSFNFELGSNCKAEIDFSKLW